MNPLFDIFTGWWYNNDFDHQYISTSAYDIVVQDVSILLSMVGTLKVIVRRKEYDEFM